MKSSSQRCPFREGSHILEATAGLLGAPTQVLQGTGGMDTPSSPGGGGGGLTGQACPRSLGEGVPTGASEPSALSCTPDLVGWFG